MIWKNKIMDILKLFSKKKIQYLTQLESSDCGPTCLKIICLYFNKNIDIQCIRNKCFINKNGVNLLDLITVAEKLGFDVYPIELSVDELIKQNTYPCLLHWDENHYVILEKYDNHNFYIANPSIGKVVLSKNEFIGYWNKEKKKGIVVFFEPNENFQEPSSNYTKSLKKDRFSIFFYKELFSLKYKFLLVFIFLLIISLISTFFPKLQQDIIDIGIKNKDKGFIIFILLSQISLYTGIHIFEYFQGFIFLKISKFFSVNLIIKFINNLTLLPLSFFDKKLPTDILSRINEHSRVEYFFFK